jgi:co-chaperonin GroES (HSP10)
MALNIKPLSDRVIVEPVAAELKLHQEFLFQTQPKENHKGIVAVEMQKTNQ